MTSSELCLKLIQNQKKETLNILIIISCYRNFSDILLGILLHVCFVLCLSDLLYWCWSNVGLDLPIVVPDSNILRLLLFDHMMLVLSLCTDIGCCEDSA